MFCTVAALCILTHGDAVTTHVVTVVATSRMERPARPLATVRCASVGHRCMSFISVDRRQFDLPIATPRRPPASHLATLRLSPPTHADLCQCFVFVVVNLTTRHCFAALIRGDVDCDAPIKQHLPI